LLYAILLSRGLRYPAIFYCSLVILGAAFSAHLKMVKRPVKARATRERAQYEPK
jgi:hypothetical protein